MIKKLLVVAFFFFCIFNNLSAQPYVDLLSLQGLQSISNNIISDNTYDVDVKWRSAQATMPFQFTDSSAFILSPGFDRWNLSSGLNIKLSTAYLPLTYFKPLSPHSRIAVVFIPRVNNSDDLRFVKQSWQYGGAVVYTWRKNSTFALKAGLYYNKEFFGDYFLPLLGIDWKVNSKLYIFGIIPNNFFIDYELHKYVHFGFAYKGITTSFRLPVASAPDYFSIEEGQLKLFLDFYLTKKIVINLEAGQTVARNYGTGMLNEDPKKIDFNDGSILKAGLNYRLWVNK